jgi:hypothetical protein
MKRAMSASWRISHKRMIIGEFHPATEKQNNNQMKRAMRIASHTRE